jgi:neutral ceramidase
MTRGLAVLALAASLLGACGHFVPKVPDRTPKPVAHQPAAVRVGTARADISMPPGAAMFGHALDARIAEGYWTRNYCRVFYFETALGHKLALIPCDLPAVSALLQRAVAEKVAPALHASQIMITATHSHAGVGHFFGSSQYTSMFSSRLPGYDEELLLALTARIAEAVERARSTARPARISWHHRYDFWGFTRNRSLAAFLLNRPRYTPPHAYPGCAAPGCPPHTADLEAVDPSLHVLRIEAFDPSSPAKPAEPIGSLSFFAMHPTVVHSFYKYFGGDTSAVVSRHVERELRREACALDVQTCARDIDPLHGVINTNEGDISPVWSRGDIDEAVAVGSAVGRFVWQTHLMPAPKQAKPLIDSRYIEVDMRGAEFRDDGAALKICDAGKLGQGVAAGGSDHRTTVAPVPMFDRAPPVDFEIEDCHAPKRPLLGGVGSFMMSREGVFPNRLPLAIAQVDEVALSFVPGELTVTAGSRLNQRVLAETANYPGRPKYALVAGLANEYIQYVATEEEYQLQDYEGASTLYGPSSARFLANRLGLLARAMLDPKVDAWLGEAREPKQIDFVFGPSEKRMARKTGDASERRHLGTCAMNVVSGPPRICMYWSDRGPGDVPLRPEAGDPRLHRFSWIEVVRDEPARRPLKLCLASAPGGACDPAGWVDDRGHEFRTRIHDRVLGGWVWSTLFSPSAEQWSELAAKGVRIRAGRETPVVESAAFSASCLPPRCTARQARLCTDGAETEDWKGLVIPVD